MNDKNALDHDIGSRPGESPLDWLTRIAPEEWDATENGYMLILQSGDRRIVVDPLSERASFDERIGVEEIDTRWRQREVIEGRWYLQTTAGLLLWDVGDSHEESEIPEATEVPESEERNGEVR